VKRQNKNKTLNVKVLQQSIRNLHIWTGSFTSVSFHVVFLCVLWCL